MNTHVMKKYLSGAVTWAVVLIACQMGAAAQQSAGTLLRYTMEENLYYLVERKLELVKKHAENTIDTCCERAVVHFGPLATTASGNRRVAPEIVRLATETSIQRPYKYLLRARLPFTKGFPTGEPRGKVDFPIDYCYLSGTFDLLPLLADKPVETGDKWGTVVTFTVRGEEGLPWPIEVANQFVRIEEVRKSRCAIVEFGFSGELKAGDHPERTTTGLLKHAIPIYTVDGHGEMALDIEAGIIIHKKQRYMWTETWTQEVPEHFLRYRPYLQNFQDLLFTSELSAELIDEATAQHLIAEAETKKEEEPDKPEEPPGPAPEKYRYAVEIRRRQMDNGSERNEEVQGWLSYSGEAGGPPWVTRVDDQDAGTVTYVSPADKLGCEIPAVAREGNMGFPSPLTSLFISANRPLGVMHVIGLVDALPLESDRHLEAGVAWTRILHVLSPIPMYVDGLFDVTIAHRVQAVEEVHGNPCAVIKYEIEGETEALKLAASSSKSKVAVEVKGNGTALFDLNDRIIVRKEQTALVHMIVCRPDSKGRWQESSEIEIEETLRIELVKRPGKRQEQCQ